MHIKYWEEIREDKFGKTGLIIIASLVIAALLSPILCPYDPKMPSRAILEPPSREHWLGTNDIGQDIWSQLIYGSRNSLLVAFGVGVFTTLLSTFIGASAALIGGMYEKIILRIIDALIVIPAFIVIIIVAAYIQPNTWLLIILISILTWQGEARVIRAQTLSLKQKPYISAARVFGASKLYLLYRHIMPDLTPILVASFIQSATRGVFMEAGLAFLGIADITTASWGLMMNHALRFYYLDAWKWWLLPTGLVLSLTIMSFVFIGHALETAMDPRLRGGFNA